MPRGVPAGAVVCSLVGALAATSWPPRAPQAAPAPAPAISAPATTAPAVSLQPSLTATFDLAVISDLNQSYGSTHYGRDVQAAVAALTQRFRPALLLITGDMVAGQRADVDAPAMWRGFRSVVLEPLRRAGIAVAPTPGNHDASPSFAGERAEYVRQWPAADAGLDFVDARQYPLRYSFTFQGAFFLSLDAASVGSLSSEQHAWVEAQLGGADGFPVKIAFGHLPLHPIARGREREVLNDDKLEALFVRYGVDLYASGHHHAYYPGATPGLRQLSMPCLGAGPRALIGTANASQPAFALLSVENGELAELEAFSAPDFTSVIERGTLPPKIALGHHLLVRDDLVPFTTAQ